MTAISTQFALADVKPDMVLCDDLLDPQGKILLPKGASLTEHTIESLHKRGVVSLRILMGELTPEEDAMQRAHFQLRLERLFRKTDDEEANGLLHRYTRTFRLGEKA